MKKLLLISAIALSSVFVNAQTCNPQYQDSTFGAWPDTIQNFDTSYVNIPYIQTLDFKAPSDAGDINPAYSGATIDSYTVTSVDGLPTGFTYTCSAANCEYTGGNAGCAELTGTANATQIGTYPITINIQATGTIVVFGQTQPFSTPYSFSGYKLVILDDTTSSGGTDTTGLGINIISPNETFVYPNPATSTINIVNADRFDNIEIYSINGQLIMAKEVSTSEEEINISELKEGVYFLNLKNGTSKVVHKFTKK